MSYVQTWDSFGPLCRKGKVPRCEELPPTPPPESTLFPAPEQIQQYFDTESVSEQSFDTGSISERSFDAMSVSEMSFDTKPSSDIITRLPLEIQLHIILEIDSQEDLERLSLAIPAIDHMRLRMPETIERHFVSIDLQGDLLQDALAILHFPSIDGSTTGEIGEHLDRWGNRGFPDPVKTRSVATIHALSAMVGKIKRYIEDFISKATNRQLSKAIFQLPLWVHPSYKSKIDDTYHYLPLESLYASERYRLMRAFLRHEILCKTHQPKVHRPRREGNLVDAPARKLWHRYWKNWDQLSGFSVTTHDALSVWEDSVKFEAYRDIVMIQCVYQYVQGVYGALSHRILHPGWFSAPTHLNETCDYKDKAILLDKRAVMRLGEDMVLPADLHIEQDVFFRSTWHPSWHFLQPATYDAALIAFGLNLLDHLLTISKSEGEVLLNNLFHEVMSNDPKGVEMHPIGPSRPSQIHQQRFLYLTPQRLWDTRQDDRQRRIMGICRHRAWALFEDGRLYPEYFDYARIYLDEACESRFWSFWDAPGDSAFSGNVGLVQPLVTEFQVDSDTFPSMQEVQPFWMNKKVFCGR